MLDFLFQDASSFWYMRVRRSICMCMLGAEITKVHRNVEYQTRLFETQCYDF